MRIWPRRPDVFRATMGDWYKPLPAAFHLGFNLAMVVMQVCVAMLVEWAGYYLAPALPAWAAFGVAVAAAHPWGRESLSDARRGPSKVQVETWSRRSDSN